jgi:hypothetical protein
MDCSDAMEVENLHRQLQLVSAIVAVDSIMDDVNRGKKGHRHDYWENKVSNGCEPCQAIEGNLFPGAPYTC